MGECMKKLVYACIGILGITHVHAKYEKRTFDQPKSTRNYTYFADDESFAVKLGYRDLRKIEAILKQHIMPNSDQDYNKRITSSFIRRVIGTCQCGQDAEMVENVLRDFEGHTMRELFNGLGLRNDL